MPVKKKAPAKKAVAKKAPAKKVVAKKAPAKKVVKKAVAKKVVKKAPAKKAVKKAGSLAMSPLKLAMRFIPGRDARKAALVRNTYKKLWYEHANWLAIQDRQSGIPLKPRSNYEMVSKLWAKAEMKKNKLPFWSVLNWPPAPPPWD